MACTRLWHAFAMRHQSSSACSITTMLSMLTPGQGLSNWHAQGTVSQPSSSPFPRSVSSLQHQQSASSSNTGHQQQLGTAAKGFDGMSLQLPNNPWAVSRRGPAVARQVLYRGPGLLIVRFLVRTKVFQLLGIFTGVLILTTALGPAPAQHSPDMLMAAAAVLVGCVVTSYCLWYYSSRYVGELSLLLPEKRMLRFSVLDFWGNRQDVDVPIARVQPPFRNCSIAEVKSLTSRTLMPVTVSGDRDYYISIPHGKLLDKEVLQKICYGSWLQEVDSAQPAQKESDDHVSTQSGQHTSCHKQ